MKIKALDIVFVVVAAIAATALLTLPSRRSTLLDRSNLVITTPEYKVDGVYLLQGHGFGGTAFVVGQTDRDLYVMTARHCMLDDKGEVVDFILVDGTRARPLAQDPTLDIAVMAIPRNGRTPHVYQIAEPELHEPAMAVGYGQVDGKQYLLCQHGQISSLNVPGSVVADLAIQVGMSGGPLLNGENQVIGVTSRCPSFAFAPNPGVSVFGRTSLAQHMLDQVMALDSKRP